MSYLDYSSQARKNNCPDFWAWTIPPALNKVQPGENESALGNVCPWLLNLDHSSGTKQSATWREWIFPREWLSKPFPKEMIVLHQPPKRTILRNCSQLWALKEWLSDEPDQSSWPLLRVTVKKRDCPRPFPHTGHKGNHCLWYINNPSNHFHYENDHSIWTIFWTGKCMSVRNLKPLSKLERNCSS